MSLAPGTRLGPYEIGGALGAGGMGEVYRARDSKLHRDVAIKILPESMARNQDRLARFEREAQVLAALNHPHIAGIHGLEEAGGVQALVLELVEGPTLAERLTHGALPIDEALDIARQTADALEAAHEQGIIHRDLKPANIKLRPDGTVKVLDFGLAKALESAATLPALANSPTLTSPAMTQAGVILGTAAYMSPEQARGRALDRRTDVWSFGCVLYECLTGRRAFPGDTVSDAVASILQTEPDWSALPAATPARVRELVRRCLTRDARRRLRDIGEARVTLDDAHAGAPEPTTAAVRERPGSRWWTGLAIAGLLATGAAVGWMLRAQRAIPVAAPSIRASIALPAGLDLDGYGQQELALSRDGRTLAFLARGATGGQQLYVRRLDQSPTTLVPNSESAEAPIFSPDGRWIAFAVGVSDNSGMIAPAPAELRKYSLETGLTQRVCALGDFFGGVWTSTDDILFVNTQPGGIWKVSASGGEPRSIVDRFRIDGQDMEARVAWPDLLPGERSLLLTDLRRSRGGDLAVLNLDSRELTPVGLAGTGARYTPTGHLVYVGQDASLMAVGFDRQTLKTAGSPVALIPDVAIARNDSPAFAFSDGGTAVYATGYLARSRREPLRLVRISPAGVRTPLSFDQDLFVRGPVFAGASPYLAASTRKETRALFNLDRMTKLELSQGDFTGILSVAISADGRRLAVGGGRSGSAGNGLYIQDVVGPAKSLETLVEPGSSEYFVAGWLPDNRTLVYSQFRQTPGTRSGATIHLHAPGEAPKAIVEGALGSEPPALSPDGRWVAFISAASGHNAIAVQSTSGPVHVISVTTKNGNSPAWSADGRELYFRREGKIFSVAVTTTGQDIAFGPERALFDWDLVLGFAPAPRGEFYGFEPVPGATRQTSLHLQTGWFDEIKRLTTRR